MKLKEKDLSYSKHKFQFIKNINNIVIKLNIIAIIFFCFFIIIIYDIEYPRFNFYDLELNALTLNDFVIPSINECIKLFLLMILPSLYSLIILFILNRINYIKHLEKMLSNIVLVLNIIILTMCITVSFISGFFMFLMAPLESVTNAPSNYLVVGNSMKEYENVYKDFFPENIPRNAKDISYSYRKYSQLFRVKALIHASWSLPPETYEHYKQIMKLKSVMHEIDKNKFEIYLNDPRYPDGLKLIFECNDNKKELKYTALIYKKTS